MIYAYIILGVLVCAMAIFVYVGLRSSSEQNAYMGAPQSLKNRPNKIQKSSHSLDGASAYPIETLDGSKQYSAYGEPPALADHNISITGDHEIESDYEDALIMLREVKAMLLQGRPDRAIKHVRNATGVDHSHAKQFVYDVQNNMIG